MLTKVKKAIAFMIILSICGSAPMVSYASDVTPQNIISSIDKSKLKEPVTKLTFVKWVLSICNSEEISRYNIDDLGDKGTELYRFAVDQGYIREGDNLQGGVSRIEAAAIADKGFEAYNSLEMFGGSPTESTTDAPNNNMSAYPLYEKPLTQYEAIVFLEKLQSSPPEIKVIEQKAGTLVTFNKGKGNLNGRPISNETLVSAVGTYKVDVTDKFGNTASADFVKKPVVIVNPLESYTPSRCAYEIDMLKVQYPDLIKSGTIGKSGLGADIPYFSIGKGQRKILLVGSVHAREHITTAYIMKMADSYAAAYYNKQKIGNYDVQKVLNDTTITFVPMLNPDGVSFVVEGYKNISKAAIEKKFGKIPDEVRYKWKETMTGVNLNRNFPFYWNDKGVGENGFLEKITGPSAASEPETKMLMAFCKSNRFEFALACHAKGEVLYWRDKKNGVINGDELLAKTIAKSTGYSIAKMTTNPTLYGGGFENWFRYAFKRPAICIEFTPHNSSAWPYRNSDFDKLIWVKANSLGLAVASLKMPWEK